MKKIKLKVKRNKPVKEKSNFGKRFKKAKIFEKLLTIIMLFLVFCFFAGLSFFVYVIFSAPEFDEENLYTSESSILYDSAGNVFAKLGTENRVNVTFDDLPDVLIDAIIATEDARYFQHSGIDMARFLKATIGQVLGQSNAGGGSTLTMQVVKQVFTSYNSSGIDGLIRKFTDIYMAVFKLEKNYTKEQIIEFYVNIPYLGGGAWGIQQASKNYFGKSVSELSLPEAALLAGLFQAPDAFDPFNYPEKATARRNQVLNLMVRHGYITQEECDAAKAISVERMLIDNTSTASLYQGYIDTVVAEVKKRTKLNPYTTSMKIYTTFDSGKQDTVNDINNGKAYKWKNDTIQTGIAVIDVKTGAILAVGAGRNRKGVSVYNYATDINRHPGSTAKPIFDYGPAIEYLNWSTGQMVVDDTHTYSNGVSLKNWDNKFQGIQTIKIALGASRNIPAVETFQKLPQAKLKTFVEGLGITPEYDANGYINESHAIGGFTGVSPLEFAAAYATFARGGIYIEPYSFTKIEYTNTGETYTVTPEKRTVMSEATAYMINYILTYAVDSGLVSAGSKSGTDIASKTGTSTVDEKLKKSLGIKASIIGDSWQIVYSPDYVCATWIGYEKITKTQYLTTSVGSTARKAISKYMTKNIMKEDSTFKKPSSVVSATIELETNPLQLASSNTPSAFKSVEYFKKGTVPSEVSKRFSQLDNPTNLKNTNENGTITLTWDAIPIPSAIEETYLRKYFDEGYGTYSKLIANKYYNLRLTYNANNIGINGYHVYINKNGTLTDLGFTTSNTFKYNGVISGTASFVVKSAYSIFKNNMSSGITTTITNITDPEPSGNWTVELNGNYHMSVADYRSFLNNGLNPIVVKNNNVDVTSSALLLTTCWQNMAEVDCNTLSCTNTYNLIHSAEYNNQTKSVSRILDSGC